MTNDLNRPIIGIENRTAQEVFDIMCSRFTAYLATLGEQAPVASEVAAMEEILREQGERDIPFAPTDRAGISLGDYTLSKHGRKICLHFSKYHEADRAYDTLENRAALEAAGRRG